MRLLLLCGGVALLMAGLEYWRRRRAWFEGPNYCAHLEQWRQSEPQIKPAALPDVVALTDTVKRRRLRKPKAEPLQGEFKRKA